MSKRLMTGKFRPDDIAAVRRLVRLSQERFAQAMNISVDLLRDWEEGRRNPRGPAIVILQIASWNPRVIRELVKPIDESVAVVGATTTPSSRSGATRAKVKKVQPRKRRPSVSTLPGRKEAIEAIKRGWGKQKRSPKSAEVDAWIAERRPAPKTSTVGDLLRLLKSMPAPDAEYRKIVRHVARNQPPVPPSPWDAAESVSRPPRRKPKE